MKRVVIWGLGMVSFLSACSNSRPLVQEDEIIEGGADIAVFFNGWDDIRISEPWVGESLYATVFDWNSFTSIMCDIMKERVIVLKENELKAIVIVARNIKEEDAANIRERVDSLFRQCNCSVVTVYFRPSAFGRPIKYRLPVRRGEIDLDSG